MVAYRVVQAIALLCGSAVAESPQRSLLSARSTKACDGDYETLKAGDICSTIWAKMTKGSHQMRPTQNGVGYAWVVFQMKDDFYSLSHTEKWLGKATHTFPVVLHDDDFYLTDRHHHAAALQLIGDANYWDLPMTLEVAADYRGMGSNFWSTMEANGYAFLYGTDDTRYDSQFARVDPATLPRDFGLTSFVDNIWRGLAAFTSHAKDDTQRCYTKECVWFIDMEWGHMFSQVAYQGALEWSDGASFRAKLEELPLKPTMKQVDLDEWWAASELLLPLCHSEAVKDFPLLEGFPSATLDGWSTTPMPDDPVCAMSRSETVV